LLIPVALVLGGCSSGYYVDLAQVRPQHLATADDSPGRPTARHRATQHQSTQAKRARAKATRDDEESAGAKGRADDLERGWPATGTPEWDRLRAQEIEREKRIDTLLRSICRGC
jgi:hypothetical protein